MIDIHTIHHENLHIANWFTFYAPGVLEAEADIENNEEVEVTLDTLNPEQVLFTKENDFFILIDTKTREKFSDYRTEAEDRAYADGRDEYQALANSIIP